MIFFVPVEWVNPILLVTRDWLRVLWLKFALSAMNYDFQDQAISQPLFPPSSVFWELILGHPSLIEVSSGDVFRAVDAVFRGIPLRHVWLDFALSEDGRLSAPACYTVGILLQDWTNG